MKIATLLLVPKPEYAEALLREGPCGARPPVMGHEAGKALVLMWEGQVCVEGIDQFQRFLNVLDLQAIHERDPKAACYVVQAQAAWWDGPRSPRMRPSVMDLCDHPVVIGILHVFGTRVCLAADGKEIR